MSIDKMKTGKIKWLNNYRLSFRILVKKNSFFSRPFHSLTPSQFTSRDRFSCEKRFISCKLIPTQEKRILTGNFELFYARILKVNEGET